MPTINHVLETALYVKDRARSQAFYETVMGFRLLLDDGNRLTGMAVGDSNQVLLLFTEGASTGGEQTPTGFIPPHDTHGTQHAAFAISEDSVDEWRQQLSSCSVPIESLVLPPRGGTSIYFRDPDNHLIELASPGIWETY
ncbi:MAG: VOC family protein [Armatimonadetes bacterium]|nr:VOC family protein [Armatimonadota bacterium]